jgi:hypothetical protein
LDKKSQELEEGKKARDLEDAKLGHLHSLEVIKLKDGLAAAKKELEYKSKEFNDVYRRLNIVEDESREKDAVIRMLSKEREKQDEERRVMARELGEMREQVGRLKELLNEKEIDKEKLATELKRVSYKINMREEDERLASTVKNPSRGLFSDAKEKTQPVSHHEQEQVSLLDRIRSLEKTIVRAANHRNRRNRRSHTTPSRTRS